MKIKNILLGILFSAICSSCTDYLDVSPDSDLTEQEIFQSYENTTKFFSGVYNGDKTGLSTTAYNLDIISAFPMEFQSGPRAFGFNQTTDLYDISKLGGATTFKQGSWGSSAFFASSTTDASSNNYRPIFKGLFNVIRVCNTVLLNIDKIQDANSQSDIEDIRGQAYFIRAYSYFVLGSIWGPLPYNTDIVQADNYDRERPTCEAFFKSVADDCDKACETFKAVNLMRRDPLPGVAGHLQDKDQNKPTGVAALALKSRALLYCASPLNNPDNNQQFWIDAAEAAVQALNAAKENGYELLPWSNYYDSFYGMKYSNEQLWAWNRVSPMQTALSKWSIKTIIGSTMTEQKECTGEFPTQNLVDMYDTKWGDPLVTEADRKKAEELGHYDESDPYNNRDPRLDGNIYYNQHSITWGKPLAGEEKNKFNCYSYFENGQEKFSTFAQGYAGIDGDTRTGYIGRKRTGDWHAGKKTPVPAITESLFRMVELYLNYAEAANEAYGPSGKSPSATMTALEAMNVVRGRVSADLILSSDNSTVATKDAFRERIQKERTIEFDQEGNHRYFDIRRWKIAGKVMSAPIYGIKIEQINSNTSLPYNQRFKQQRYLLTNQCNWKDEMYYWPFPKNDYYKYDVFDTSLNPWW